MKVSAAISKSVGDVGLLAASFTRYLRAANRSPKTIQTYRQAVDGLVSSSDSCKKTVK